MKIKQLMPCHIQMKIKLRNPKKIELQNVNHSGSLCIYFCTFWVQFLVGLGVSFNMKVLTCKFKFVRYRDGAAGGYCVSVGTTNSAHHVACLYLLMYFLGKISCWVR